MKESKNNTDIYFLFIFTDKINFSGKYQLVTHILSPVVHH